MTLHRPTIADDLRHLKQATRRQIRACGGLEGAALSTRVGKTELGVYQSEAHKDRFIPIDVAADLMLISRSRDILNALAALAGCAVMPVETRANGLSRDIASFAEHASETFRDYILLGGDRTAAPKDVARLDRDLELVVEAAMQARADLRRRP